MLKTYEKIVETCCPMCFSTIMIKDNQHGPMTETEAIFDSETPTVQLDGHGGDFAEK